MAWERGFYFDPKGFEELAKISFDRGEVLVLSNHSSHFHVAVNYLESMTDGEPKEVELLQSFPYEGSFLGPFKQAVNFATDWAVEHTEDGQ